MSIEITVPILPESIADALLLEWNIPTGTQVSRDQVLVELETDKVVLEVVAPSDGVITEILQANGATVTSGQVLAKLTAKTATKTSAATVKERPPEEAKASPSPATSAVAAHEALPMSPAVRRMVAEHGLEVSDIRGSGSGGRITKTDILDFMRDRDAPPAETQPDASAASAATTAPPASNIQRQQTREPMSRLRQTIAARLLQAQQNAALLTTFNQVNMQPVMDVRTQCQEEFEKAYGTRLGFMSFFVKASVAALQKFPLVNAYIEGSEIVQHNYYDIGIAVSSTRGLVVPVIRNCDRLNFAEIETQIRTFGSRAAAGKLSLDELIGATFTITNGGVFGSLLSTPIVNPPQSAILGMHKIEPRPIAENQQVVIRPMMYLALTYDHRLIDGQQAVQFLITVKETLESPAKMMLQI